MRKLVLTVVAAVVVAVVVALPAGAGSPPSGPIGTDIGVFEAVCTFSHESHDDPIVFPHGPGATHLHHFLGARGTDAFSTPESIRQADTTCVRHSSPQSDADRSAYWVPALYVNDQLVYPTVMGAYYRAGRRHVNAIEPFPEGLQVIAGKATGGPQEVDAERVWAYLCPGGEQTGGTQTQAPTCKTPLLELAMRFPDCWDGARLDSPDHQSHMAYSRREHGATARTCPATHPRLVPALQLILRYPTTGGPSLRLSSGPINTAHADFMNGWDQARQAALVDDCLVADKYCGGGDIPLH